MRRDAMKLVAGVVTAMLMVACGGTKTDETAVDTAGPRPPKRDTITMTVVCGDSTFVKVDPWALRLKKNDVDDIEIVLASESSVDEVDITLKTDTSSWPLTVKPPYKIRKNAKGEQKQSGSAEKGKYAYNIIASCTVNGQARKLVIDPDIFVD